MPFWRTLEGLLAAVLLQQGSGEQQKSRFTLMENVCLETADVSLHHTQQYPESYDGCAIALLATEGIHATRTKQYSTDFDAYDVRYFVHHGISPKKALKHFRHEKLSTKVPFSYAAELAQLTDAERLPLYTGWNINAFFISGIPSEEIIELSALRDGTGKPLLTASNILAFKAAGGTVGYACDLANLRDEKGNPLLTGFHIFRYAQLGMTKEEIIEFRDTEKPNALLIFPTADYNEVFQLDSVSTLVQEIKKTYDVLVHFAITEQDFYDAILSVPDTELLFIAGHGSSKTLRLGGKGAEAAWIRRGGEKKVTGIGKHLYLYNRDMREEYFIDTSDKVLEYYLSSLHPDATIFLLSCLTADGGQNSNNLATFMSSIARGRRVLAAKESFTPIQVQVNSLYPFDVLIMKDVTYSNK